MKRSFNSVEMIKFETKVNQGQFDDISTRNGEDNHIKVDGITVGGETFVWLGPNVMTRR